MRMAFAWPRAYPASDGANAPRDNVGKRRDAAVGGHAAGGYATGDCCDLRDKPRSHDTSRRQRPNSWLGWARSFLLRARGVVASVPAVAPRDPPPRPSLAGLPRHPTGPNTEPAIHKKRSARASHPWRPRRGSTAKARRDGRPSSIPPATMLMNFGGHGDAPKNAHTGRRTGWERSHRAAIFYEVVYSTASYPTTDATQPTQ